MNDERELNEWLKRQPLSPTEAERLGRLRQALKDVRDDTTLTPEEKAALIERIRAGLPPEEGEP